MIPIPLGYINNGTGQHQSNTVWWIGSVCPCISTLGTGKGAGGTQQIKVMVNGSQSDSTDGQHNNADNGVLEINKGRYMNEIKNICYLTPNNFHHKAGDGTKTRKRNISYIHPALQANCGETQCTYVLVKVKHEENKDKTSN